MKKVLPPLTVLKLRRLWPHARRQGHEIGEIRRVGYYSPQDGLDCIWLVDNDGKYNWTADRKWVLDKFEVVKLSKEKDFYGQSRPEIGKLKLKSNEPALREACRRFSYVKDFSFTLAIFHPCAALKTAKPINGETTIKPYRGQRYDKNKWAILEKGWDHDHCTLCTECIDDGDAYWKNRRSVTILCQRCYELFKDKIEKRTRTREGSQRR